MGEGEERLSKKETIGDMGVLASPVTRQLKLKRWETNDV